VIYFDDREMGVRIESFFTEKTQREKGFSKRICYNEYSPNKYFRKVRQEVYYTDAFSEKNGGIAKQIDVFHYTSGNQVRIESTRFDKKGMKILGKMN